MRDTIRLKGKLRRYLMASLYLGFLLIAINLVIYLLNVSSGLLLTGFVIFYFAVLLTLLIYSRQYILNELVTFAAQYGQIQKTLLYELDLPYAILDNKGRIIWTNRVFEKITNKGKGYKKSVATIFPLITMDKLPNESDETELKIDYEKKRYIK